MKIAVVGATGLVGTEMIRQIEARGLPVTELIPVASTRSVGKTILFKGEHIEVISMQEAIDREADIALFSAGGSTSLEFAEQFAAKGTIVIDNSSAWRMDPNKSLIIPEINGAILSESDKIIANPNCSTIQLLMAVAPLHRAYKIDRMIISTYQSITGTGVKAVQQLENEEAGLETDKAYDHPIYRNCIPQCDVFESNAYTKEEMKLVRESRKILAEPNLKVTATAVRIPVVGGHSESINISFKKPFELGEVISILNKTPNLKVMDDPSQSIYPMPIHSEGKDDVFVGRIRRDESAENSLNLWVVADNLRKGAATNALQIAELLIEKGLVKELV